MGLKVGTTSLTAAVPGAFAARPTFNTGVAAAEGASSMSMRIAAILRAALVAPIGSAQLEDGMGKLQFPDWKLPSKGSRFCRAVNTEPVVCQEDSR